MNYSLDNTICMGFLFKYLLLCNLKNPLYDSHGILCAFTIDTLEFWLKGGECSYGQPVLLLFGSGGTQLSRKYIIEHRGGDLGHFGILWYREVSRLRIMS